jgi:LPXTG-motif cell wall-anchored protein
MAYISISTRREVCKMNSPLKVYSIAKRAVTILLIVSLLLIPGLSFASYHSIGEYAPTPPPPPPPETPGDLAPIPEPEEPEAPDNFAPTPTTEEPEKPDDLAPIPETTEEEDAEAVDEGAEEELDSEELILETEEPETEPIEEVIGVSQANAWILFLGLLFVILLIWLLIKRRRTATSNE